VSLKYEVYPEIKDKLKIQNGWKGKGSNNCDDGNPVVSSILAHFALVITLKPTCLWVVRV